MNVCYVKECNNYDETLKEWQIKLPLLFKKLILKLKYYFNVIEVKAIENKRICILPMLKSDKLGINKLNKFANILSKKNNTSYSYNLVLSNYLSSIDEFKQCLQKYNILNRK